MKRYVAVVVGLSGLEFYLAGAKETFDSKEADTFGSTDEALSAAQAHIGAFPTCIARQLKARVEPLRGAR